VYLGRQLRFLNERTAETSRTLGGINVQDDERDALLFTKSFLQELKDRGWFVGEILGRLEAMDTRLASLESARQLQPSA
jgi:hypothetical protein